MTRCEKLKNLQEKARKNMVLFAEDKNLHDFWSNAFSGIGRKLSGMTIQQLSKHL